MNCQLMFCFCMIQVQFTAEQVVSNTGPGQISAGDYDHVGSKGLGNCKNQKSWWHAALATPYNDGIDLA